jgi:hypothetical protein
MLPNSLGEVDQTARGLGDLNATERERVVNAIHREAQSANWHTLNNREKSRLYLDWSKRFNLTRTALKDQIMKGFDVAQRIPPRGEAAVHEEIKLLLERSSIPYWEEKKALWGGRAFADFVVGFGRNWWLVLIELESASFWQRGLMQALWYRSAYFNQSGLQALAGLILFGDVSRKRWEEIKSTCITLNVLLLTHHLFVEGDEADFSIEILVGT